MTAQGCLSDDAILDFVEGRLDDVAQAAFGEHLDRYNMTDANWAPPAAKCVLYKTRNRLGELVSGEWHGTVAREEHVFGRIDYIGVDCTGLKRVR